ncbi:SOLUTE CARRIER FAMILY 2 FACILITATED GLUCOSE TRANSPORTER [Salix koriyanagi]|uniref:SOLUTE CARRIER FAMILY 2 FACILITATED GLUCOSE TRANSPORTER n=2 Tax=Salix TaxID=40685 RepID=A0A9Q0X2R1_9ROSI|nr:SOLUTE CARRIER FAMILY 2 FACILITATED GLUCOSE TRANSPORTER [Salix koriyanagi]
MPGLSMAESGGGRDFPAKLTLQVFICTIIAAFGGLMFGYDIGISGGVTSMDDFLEKFFPAVYLKKHEAREDNYCKYDNQFLQLFTSSLYLAAIVSSFIASFFCKKFGRKPTIQAASIFFLAGAVLNAAAVDLGMLIAGRLCLGVGVGFGNQRRWMQAVPLFISEIAPAKYRGGLNICFQLLITIGILIANLINYATSKVHPYGWRISLGGAAAPAIILAIGSLAIMETPTSLLERGKNEEALRVLRKIRGVENVDKEYSEILNAIELAKQVKHPYRNLMSRSNRPQLICGTVLQFFQQFTGINVVMFYAPSFLSILLEERYLLIEACLQMLVAQSIMGRILAVHLKSTNIMPGGSAKLVVILICVFVSGFAWSWGPLGWLIPSEIFPLETRSAGFFFAVSMNMFCTFLVAQAFLTMLCHMRSGIFFFFAAWIVVMGIFAIFFLPETKGIPIDEMNERVWKKHWFWKRYYKGSEINKRRQEIQDKPEEESLE